MSSRKRNNQSLIVRTFKSRRIALVLPELYKQVWFLILEQCNWPEWSAMRMVCKLHNELIPRATVNIHFLRWMHHKDRILPTTRIVHANMNVTSLKFIERWMTDSTSQQPNAYVSKRWLVPPKPHVVVHRTMGRATMTTMMFILDHMRKNKCKYKKWSELSIIGKVMGPMVARFARSHGHIIQSCPINWDTYFK